MVGYRNSQQTGKIAPGDYLILNADKEGNNCTYLSFQSTTEAMMSAGPMCGFFSNTLVTSGNRAVQFRVSYPPQFEGDQLGLQCVWMGPKGKGHSNFGKVVATSSLSRLRLVDDSPPCQIIAHKIPNAPDQYYLEIVADAGKSNKSNKYLYAAGNKVTVHPTLKSIWKFVLLGCASPADQC